MTTQHMLGGTCDCVPGVALCLGMHIFKYRSCPDSEPQGVGHPTHTELSQPAAIAPSSIRGAVNAPAVVGQVTGAQRGKVRGKPATRVPAGSSSTQAGAQGHTQEERGRG